MKFSIGNILFFWERTRVFDFYDEVMNSSAEVVYIGESVCSKRRELSLADWLDIGKQLEIKGKQVVLSGLALLEAKSELATLKKVCNNGHFLVEANDFGAVQLSHEAALPFVAGSALNIYNQLDLKHLYEMGMQRWVMPVELSRDWLKNTKHQLNAMKLEDAFEIEVQAYGYLPLAYAARCFTARSENRPKDQCKLCCINYPQGRDVKSQEGSELFKLNGIQTLSGKAQNLINDIPSMHDLVDIARISPDSIESLAWLDKFKSNVEGQTSFDTHNFCNGYWHKIEGMTIHE